MIIRRRWSARRRGMWLRGLARLLACGLPVDEALATLAHGDDGLSASLRRALIGGRSLAAALADRKAAFDDVTTALVEAGEARGRLADALDETAAVCERQAKIRAAALSAGVYPLVILVLAGALVAVMSTVVLPRFRDAFSRLGVPLPTATRLMLALGRNAPVWIPALLTGLVSIVLGWRYLGRQPEWRRRQDRLRNALPVISSWRRSAALARSASVLAGALGAGVSLDTALPLASRVGGDSIEADRWRETRRQVAFGRSLAEAGLQTGALPHWAAGLVRQGEATGRLAEATARMAELAADDLERRATLLSKTMEPAMILVAGAVTAMIAWAVFAPLLAAVEGLSQ